MRATRSTNPPRPARTAWPRALALSAALVAAAWGGSAVAVDWSGVEAREGEDALHEPSQSLALTCHQGSVFPGIAPTLGQGLGQEADGREGAAELVGHPGQERLLPRGGAGFANEGSPHGPEADPRRGHGHPQEQAQRAKAQLPRGVGGYRER